ncbi:MAG: hypothetical protein AAFR98_10995 [Pseudomonadota bacterium]
MLKKTRSFLSSLYAAWVRRLPDANDYLLYAGLAAITGCFILLMFGVRGAVIEIYLIVTISVLGLWFLAILATIGFELSFRGCHEARSVSEKETSHD